MYLPSEDSFFFQEFLEKYFSNIKKEKLARFSVLDMGCGTGILAKTCSKFIPKKNILCADIQKESLDLLKNSGFIVIKTNLFKNISPSKKFDLIIFNAPYLPEDKREPKASKIETTGGKRGDEICLSFLKQAKSYLKKEGKILLLISSFTPLSKIKDFQPKIVGEKKIFFEKLIILEFS